MYRESLEHNMADTPFWKQTFDLFINNFIVSKQSLFLEKDNNAITFDGGIVQKCLKLLDGVTTMNPQTDKVSLYSKLSQYTGDKKLEVYSLLWHCYYIMYIMGPTSKKFLPDLMPSELKIKEEKETPKLFVEEYASTRQIFSKEPIRPFRCLLNLFNYLWNNQEQGEDIVDAQGKGIEGIKGQIIKILLTDKDKYWKEEKRKEDFDERIKNILIYLCAPDNYVPIISQTHKDNIFKNLKGIIEAAGIEATGTEAEGTKEIILHRIKSKLEEIANSGNVLARHKNNVFYNDIIRPFWDESSPDLGTEELSDEILLEYKKAMVLYGPPGTGKSYQARRMAENIIAKELLRSNNNRIADCISKLDDSFNSHIHILQMHPNYTYDDFIIGKSIENGNVVVKLGKMLKLIEQITKDTNDALPHFVILDEINRVDITRVFGELFTAMEPSYRNKGVDLSMDAPRLDVNGVARFHMKLIVPDNLYFIGTMNQIDFSLEQVDFALRRRFIWRFRTYDRKRLDEIINEKKDKRIEELKNLKKNSAMNSAEKQPDDMIVLWQGLPVNYVDTCTNLNNVIKSEPSLGKDYLIGHTFFAEIVDIFERVKNWEIAKNILWQVSILPTLDAYCGTMDSEMQKRFVGDCKDAFLPELKDNKKKDNSKQSQDSEITNGQ